MTYRRVAEIEALARTVMHGEDDIAHLARHFLAGRLDIASLMGRVAELEDQVTELQTQVRLAEMDEIERPGRESAE